MPAIKEQKVHFKPKDEPWERPVNCAGAMPEDIRQHTPDIDRVTCQACIIRIVDTAMRYVNRDEALT